MDNQELDKKIDETLRSLEGIQPADPGAYFASKTMARMERTEVETGSALVWKLALAVLIAFNGISFFYTAEGTSESSKDPMVEMTDQYFGSEEVQITSLLDYPENE